MVKTDDDIYVDLYGTFSLARRLRAEEVKIFHCFYKNISLFIMEIFQRSRGEMFMMGLVNRLATEVIRSPEHPWSKWLGKSGPEL